MKVPIPASARASPFSGARATLFLLAAACSLSPVAEGGAQAPDSGPEMPAVYPTDEAASASDATDEDASDFAHAGDEDAPASPMQPTRPLLASLR